MGDVEMYGMKISPMPKSVRPKMVRVKRNKEWEKKHLEIIGECIKKSNWKFFSPVNGLHDKN